MCIGYDVHTCIYLKFSHDKPDIVVYDKQRNEMIIMDVGTISLERLKK